MQKRLLPLFWNILSALSCVGKSVADMTAALIFLSFYASVIWIKACSSENSILRYLYLRTRDVVRADRKWFSFQSSALPVSTRNVQLNSPSGPDRPALTRLAPVSAEHRQGIMPPSHICGGETGRCKERCEQEIYGSLPSFFLWTYKFEKSARSRLHVTTCRHLFDHFPGNTFAGGRLLSLTHSEDIYSLYGSATV